MLSGQTMELAEQHRTSPLAAQAAETVFTPEGMLLIVDDDDAVRAFVCVASRRLGYKVIDAVNGIEALKRFEETPGHISLVLTDINMPLMDGLTLVKALRKHPSTPAIAVMSGRLEPSVRTTLRVEQVTALLSKPFSLEALRLTLLEAAAARRE
jgi:two-component system, cell cycle sensor histidine kinase and response regulator CckA